MQLVGLDYLILALLGISGLLGVLRGFVREIFSLVTWIAAVWLAIHYSGHVASYLEPFLESTPLRKAAAFCIVLFATLVAGAVVGSLIAKLLSSAGMSGTDRLVGLVFGTMRGALLVALLAAVAERTQAPQAAWWKQSVLMPTFQPLTIWIAAQLQQGGKLMNSIVH